MSTIYREPLDKVKAFMQNDGKRAGIPWLTKAGNWCITLYTMMRLDADTEEYEARCYRMEGIKLDTVLVNNGPRGKMRVFPNAARVMVEAR